MRPVSVRGRKCDDERKLEQIGNEREREREK